MERAAAAAAHQLQSCHSTQCCSNLMKSNDEASSLVAAAGEQSGEGFYSPALCGESASNFEHFNIRLPWDMLAVLGRQTRMLKAASGQTYPASSGATRFVLTRPTVAGISVHNDEGSGGIPTPAQQ
ncbi:hypothetical protein EYF80_018065 [Liparis tanakae]|uniref:Uncharacterized protein n=1 Tax=Liparis tanakae TaxID=230148 RepID=A0A4Z2I325_9TELE|nr:hypothetical protein EYF80_018065 [Liparis tanakae]